MQAQYTSHAHTWASSLHTDINPMFSQFQGGSSIWSPDLGGGLYHYYILQEGYILLHEIEFSKKWLVRNGLLSFKLNTLDPSLITLGHNCHIRQFCKVSIQLPYMAVLWTHFCVDRTAIYGSSMDTFFSPTKLPYMAVLWTLFGCLSQNPYKTADLSSSMDTFRLQAKVSIELPYVAVLVTPNLSKLKVFIELPRSAFLLPSHRTAIYGSSMDTFVYNRKVSIELLRSAVLQGFWLRQPKSIH